MSLGTTVHWEESGEKLLAYIHAAEKDFAQSDFGARFLSQDSSLKLPHLMITGYIATTPSGACVSIYTHTYILNMHTYIGIATTLKRDGSDFSASIFGKLLRATGITIWTDVSGVYSADPRRVPDAQIIPEVREWGHTYIHTYIHTYMCRYPTPKLSSWLTLARK